MHQKTKQAAERPCAAQGAGSEIQEIKEGVMKRTFSVLYDTKAKTSDIKTMVDTAFKVKHEEKLEGLSDSEVSVGKLTQEEFVRYLKQCAQEGSHDPS